MHQTYAVRVASLWRFLIYAHQHEIQAVAVAVECLMKAEKRNFFYVFTLFLAAAKLNHHNLLHKVNLPDTLAIGISPRSNALMLFSIWRNGAPSPCDSLSGSSSSSIGGAKSRRGVDTKSTPLE